MLSKTVEYALRAVMHLASLPDDRSASSSAVAAATHVPQGYLSKVLRDLVVAGLVASQRGPHGGFSLARPPRDISILDVINAVDPIPRIERCPLGNPDHSELCPLHRRLDDALAAFENEFRCLALQDVLDMTIDPAQCAGAATPPPKSAP
ncbi:MAG: Rrf2 family transcriptional regulator [Phycisphaerales bacterium]